MWCLGMQLGSWLCGWFEEKGRGLGPGMAAAAGAARQDSLHGGGGLRQWVSPGCSEASRLTTLGGSEALSFEAFVAEQQGCCDSRRCCAAGGARGAEREGLAGGVLGLGAVVCCRWRTSSSSGSKVVGTEVR